jgi:hypothetical protein
MNVILYNFYSTSWTLLTHYPTIGSRKEGIVTNTYGPQYSQDKDNFLKSLSIVGNLVGQQWWNIGGDFNIIFSLEEKKGEVRILDKDNEKFQNLIENLHLIDVEARNDTFT